MKLLYRLGFYLGGFSVGLIFLAFILNGKKTSCNYTPNARVIDNLLQKKIVLSEEIIKDYPLLKDDQIKEMIQTGTVNFSKSDTKRDSSIVSHLTSKLGNCLFGGDKLFQDVEHLNIQEALTFFRLFNSFLIKLSSLGVCPCTEVFSSALLIR